MKIFILLLALAVPAVAQTFHPASVEVYFSPDGGCTDAIVAELGRAKKTVYVQAYSFTSAPIAKAIVDASKRGVAVQVVVNPSPTTTFRYAEGLKIQVTMAKARNVAVRDENLGSTERSGEGSRGAGVRSTWPLRLVNPLSA